MSGRYEIERLENGAWSAMFKLDAEGYGEDVEGRGFSPVQALVTCQEIVARAFGFARAEVEQEETKPVRG